MNSSGEKGDSCPVMSKFSPWRWCWFWVSHIMPWFYWDLILLSPLLICIWWTSVPGVLSSWIRWIIFLIHCNIWLISFLLRICAPVLSCDNWSVVLFLCYVFFLVLELRRCWHHVKVWIGFHLVVLNSLRRIKIYSWKVWGEQDGRIGWGQSKMGGEELAETRQSECSPGK